MDKLKVWNEIKYFCLSQFRLVSCDMPGYCHINSVKSNQQIHPIIPSGVAFLVCVWCVIRVFICYSNTLPPMWNVLISGPAVIWREWFICCFWWRVGQCWKRWAYISVIVSNLKGYSIILWQTFSKHANAFYITRQFTDHWD